MNLAARNRIIRSLLAKAGFSIEKVADMPLGSVVQRLHQHCCGMLMADSRRSIMFGASASGDFIKAEQCAQVGRVACLRDLAEKPHAQGNAAIYLVGPGARYVAKGYGFHLAKFVELVDEHDEAAREANAQARMAADPNQA